MAENKQAPAAPQPKKVPVVNQVKSILGEETIYLFVLQVKSHHLLRNTTAGTGLIIFVCLDTFLQ